jgi:S-phase entry cyclin 5/6
MTIALIDEYSSNNDISLTNYQLLGISSLFISAKYEEIELPRFKDYFRLVEDQY